MPSAFSHAAIAVTIAGAFPKIRTARLLVTGAVGAALPDADVIGFRFGIHYEDMLGHRGLSHSIFFALVLAVFVAWMTFKGFRWQHTLYLFLAAVSHGIFDAMTNGGLGIAFFAPFSRERYFFPFRPIQVSPIGIHSFLSDRGFAVLVSELIWIWLPCFVMGGLAYWLTCKPSKLRRTSH